MADTTETRSHTEVDLDSLEKNTIEKTGEPLENDDIQKAEGPQSAAPAQPQHEAPEGGLKAWLAVAGASAALFTSFGWTNCIGLFQDEYQTNQLKQYSSSTVSWITSVQCMFIPRSQETKWIVLKGVLKSLLYAGRRPSGRKSL